MQIHRQIVEVCISVFVSGKHPGMTGFGETNKTNFQMLQDNIWSISWITILVKR